MRILNQLQSRSDDASGAPRLCQVCADVLQMSGAGLMLISDDIPRGSVCSSNSVSELIEDLQYTLGQGPCIDAYEYARPVLEPDLANPVTPRWIAFTPPAVAAGARAVFGFPMVAGSVRLGALNLYRDQPGPLTDDQHADALVASGVAARAVLDMQAHAPPGRIAFESEIDSDFKFVVHQAAGMVSVQLGVTVAEALIRLRAFAFANNLLVDEVAQQVVSRRLRFD